MALGRVFWKPSCGSLEERYKRELRSLSAGSENHRIPVMCSLESRVPVRDKDLIRCAGMMVGEAGLYLKGWMHSLSYSHRPRPVGRH